MHESIFDKSVNRWAEWIIRFWIIDIESDHIKLIDKMDVKKKKETKGLNVIICKIFWIVSLMTKKNYERFITKKKKKENK